MKDNEAFKIYMREVTEAYDIYLDSIIKAAQKFHETDKNSLDLYMRQDASLQKALTEITDIYVKSIGAVYEAQLVRPTENLK